MKIQVCLIILVAIIAIACGGGGGGSELAETAAANALIKLSGKVEFIPAAQKARSASKDSLVELLNIYRGDRHVAVLGDDHRFTVDVPDGDYLIKAYSTDGQLLKKIVTGASSHVEELILDSQSTAVSVFLESLVEAQLSEMDRDKLIAQMSELDRVGNDSSEILTNPSASQHEKMKSIQFLSLIKKVEDMNRKRETTPLDSSETIKNSVLDSSLIEEFLQTILSEIIAVTGKSVVIQTEAEVVEVNSSVEIESNINVIINHFNTGEEKVNRTPVAIIAPHKNIELGEKVRLDASSSYDADGDKLFFKWKLVKGPQLTMEKLQSKTLTITPKNIGRYTFGVEVKDAFGASGRAQVSFEVEEKAILNQKPLAEAGPFRVVQAGTDVYLDGTRSVDKDGKIVTYQWVCTSHDDVELTNSDNVISHFKSDEVADYHFKLIVTDDKGAVDTDVTSVFVAKTQRYVHPKADAGKDQKVFLGEEFVLDARGSHDPEGNIGNYHWFHNNPAQVLDPRDANKPLIKIKARRAGSFEYQLHVHHKGKSAYSSDKVRITVLDDKQKVIADAGPDQVVSKNDEVVLNAGASRVMGDDKLHYEWTQLYGKYVEIEGRNLQRAKFVSNGEQLVFALKAANLHGDSDIDIVVVRSPDEKRTERIECALGPNETLKAGERFVLSNRHVKVPFSGGARSVHYELVSRPDGADRNLRFKYTNRAMNTVYLDPTRPGTYLVKRRVAWSGGKYNDDFMCLKVMNDEEKNLAPAAVARREVPVKGLNRIVLNGKDSSDTDGKVTRYRWTQVAGKRVYKIMSNRTSQAYFIPLVEDDVAFKLEVMDDDGAWASTLLKFHVDDPKINLRPVASACFVRVDGNRVELDASKSFDPDGAITEYRWSMVKGKWYHKIKEFRGKKAYIDLESNDDMTCRLRVKDDKGAWSQTDISFSVVLQKQKIRPVAIARYAIQSFRGRVLLQGYGSYDRDGRILSYKWIQLEGSVEYSIRHHNHSDVYFDYAKSDRVKFRLEVTDDTGLVATKDVAFTIATPKVNKKPIANAGVDQEIGIQQLCHLSGRHSRDPDGHIASYRWRIISAPSNSWVQHDPVYFFKTGDRGIGATFAPDVVGTYVFEFSVKDNQGACAADTVKIKVVSLPLVAKISMRKEEKTSKTFLHLDGSASTPAKDIVSYKWSYSTGSKFYHHVTRKTALMIFKTSGMKTIRLDITDRWGRQASKSITVRIKTIDLPTPVITHEWFKKHLIGEAIFLDGSKSYSRKLPIVSYRWKLENAPLEYWKNLKADVQIINAHGKYAKFIPTHAGSYEFSLEVAASNRYSAKRFATFYVVAAQ